jgi:hypothetical protein
MKKATPILVIAGLIMLLGLGVAYAAYPSLTTGYAIDSNYHGINVPPGSNVIVTAYTTDVDVYQVTFIWKYPNGTMAVGPEVDNTPVAGDPYKGNAVNTFSSTHPVSVKGDWGVQALFQGPDGKTKESIDYVVSIKATSFFVVPDFPMIGTVGSLGAMFLGLGLFIRRKSRLAK